MAKTYELKKPIYPDPLIKAEFDKAGKPYTTSDFVYDDLFINWWNVCIEPGKIDPKLKKPITREIMSIKRIKIGTKEKVEYYEKLTGEDFTGSPRIFTHKYGKIKIPKFTKTFDFERNVPIYNLSGATEDRYIFDYSEKLIKELLSYEPDDVEVQLAVQIGTANYGARGIFTFDEFAKLPIEQLAKIAMSGKGIIERSADEIFAQTRTPQEVIIQKNEFVKKETKPKPVQKPKPELVPESKVQDEIS